MAKIIVKISKLGKPTEVEAHDIKGTGCEALLDALTRELGEVLEDRPTADYWEAEHGELIAEGTGW